MSNRNIHRAPRPCWDVLIDILNRLGMLQDSPGAILCFLRHALLAFYTISNLPNWCSCKWYCWNIFSFPIYLCHISDCTVLIYKLCYRLTCRMWRIMFNRVWTEILFPLSRDKNFLDNFFKALIILNLKWLWWYQHRQIPCRVHKWRCV